MIIEDLEGASCAGQADIFDPDMHHHLYLGSGNDCWICDEARDICIECPVIEACFAQGRRQRESHMIRAGFAWTNGRPRDLRKRRK
jgi:hypothetical protein